MRYEINDQLASTAIGIICLTKENKNKPWILFESGALAKGLSSNRVCTFLIDLLPTDLENPLAQFNHTFPTKDSVWELVRTINLALKEHALKEAVLSKVFETYWKQFEEDFKEIISSTPETPISEKRPDNDIMLDVLSTVRMLDRRLRNMEMNDDLLSKVEKDSLRRDRMSPSVVKATVRNLIDQNVPEELIVELITEKGAPRSFVRDEVARQLGTKKEESTDN